MKASAPQERMAKARSLPSSGPFISAVFFYFAHWFLLAGSIVLMIHLFRHGNPQALRPLLALLVLTAFTGIVSFAKRRTTLCPLCRSTPMMHTGACPHQRARRIWPLPHTTSAMLSMLLTKRFRCMYCATDYDLFKQSSRQKRQKEEKSKQQGRIRKKRRKKSVNPSR